MDPGPSDPCKGKYPKWHAQTAIFVLVIVRNIHVTFVVGAFDAASACGTFACHV